MNAPSIMRRAGVASVGLVAAASLFTAPVASADTGDDTPAETANTIAMSTDACPLAEGRVVPNGQPGTPLLYQIYFGGDGCVMRANLVGVRDGRVVQSGFVRADGNNGYILAKQINRCYVQFDVQRRDGTYYTRSITPRTLPEMCPE